MNTKKIIPVILLAIMLLFSSCFHKNVMTDQADDIIKVVQYSQNDTIYLITMETIFQANSKSSSGGVTTISGHNDIRISVYNIETGELVVRKKFGKISKGKNTIILGVTPGNLWLYSNDKNLGLYSVEPLSLEIRHSQEQLLEANPELKDMLTTPDYYSIQNFYSFDYIEQKPIVTDIKGYRYYINPVTLKAEKINEELDLFRNPSYDYFNTSVRINSNYLRLSGKLRKKIEYHNKIYNDNLDFLDGEFIVSQNFRKMYILMTERFENFRNEYNTICASFDSIESEYGDQYWSFPKELSERYRDLRTKKDRMKSRFQEYERIIKDIRSSSPSFDMLLQTDTSSFYIAHRSNTNKDAFLTISKISKQNDTIFSELWSTTLPNVFFDYSAASQTDMFKEVFSKGSPEFDFEYFDIAKDKLIIIYTLNMICIDTNTGEILWQFRI